MSQRAQQCSLTLMASLQTSSSLKQRMREYAQPVGSASVATSPVGAPSSHHSVGIMAAMADVDGPLA